VGQVTGADGCDPFGEFGVVAGGGSEKFGELVDEAGEFCHLRAGGGEVAEEFGVLVAQVVGAGQEESGQVARGDEGPVAFGAALGEVAVEEVEAAGVALLLDFAEELQHGHRGVR
jgi:hypothetical protein